MSTFYRDTDRKVIAGVCSGLGERFGWDVTTVRLVAVVLAIVTTGWVVPLIYLAAWLALPAKSDGRLGFDDVKDAYDARVKPTVDEKVKPTVDGAFARPSAEPGPAPQAPQAAEEKAEWEQPYDAARATGSATDEPQSPGADPFDLGDDRHE